jgi:hypothetical protein
VLGHLQGADDDGLGAVVSGKSGRKKSSNGKENERERKQEREREREETFPLDHE